MQDLQQYGYRYSGGSVGLTGFRERGHVSRGTRSHEYSHTHSSRCRSQTNSLSNGLVSML